MNNYFEIETSDDDDKIKKHDDTIKKCARKIYVAVKYKYNCSHDEIIKKTNKYIDKYGFIEEDKNKMINYLQSLSDDDLNELYNQNKPTKGHGDFFKFCLLLVLNCFAILSGNQPQWF